MVAQLWRPNDLARYFNVYGPGQDPSSEYAAVIPRFIVACLTDKRPTIYGDGDQSRDFTYIDDVVDANLRALASSDSAFGRAFNIAGGRPPTSVNRLLNLIGELTGRRPDPTHVTTREGDIRRSQADVSAARSAIAYESRFTIEDGLRRTVDSYS